MNVSRRNFLQISGGLIAKLGFNAPIPALISKTIIPSTAPITFLDILNQISINSGTSIDLEYLKKLINLGNVDLSFGSDELDSLFYDLEYLPQDMADEEEADEIEKIKKEYEEALKIGV